MICFPVKHQGAVMPIRPRDWMPEDLVGHGMGYTGNLLQFAIENGKVQLIYPWKMLIFHSYVNVYQRGYPEGEENIR